MLFGWHGIFFTFQLAWRAQSLGHVKGLKRLKPRDLSIAHFFLPRLQEKNEKPKAKEDKEEEIWRVLDFTVFEPPQARFRWWFNLRLSTGQPFGCTFFRSLDILTCLWIYITIYTHTWIYIYIYIYISYRYLYNLFICIHTTPTVAARSIFPAAGGSGGSFWQWWQLKSLAARQGPWNPERDGELIWA